MNMIQPRNGQLQSEPEPSKPKGRFTGERLLRDRPRVYRRVVELLAEPGISINGITKMCRVSEHTVRAVREREAIPTAERKQQLASILGNVAVLGAERLEQLVGKAALRDAGITTGIATDKLLALLGETGCGVPVTINMNVVAQGMHERFARLHEYIVAELQPAKRKASRTREGN